MLGGCTSGRRGCNAGLGAGGEAAAEVCAGCEDEAKLGTVDFCCGSSIGDIVGIIPSPGKGE